MIDQEVLLLSGGAVTILMLATADGLFGPLDTVSTHIQDRWNNKQMHKSAVMQLNNNPSKQQHRVGYGATLIQIHGICVACS